MPEPPINLLFSDIIFEPLGKTCTDVFFGLGTHADGVGLIRESTEMIGLAVIADAGLPLIPEYTYAAHTTGIAYDGFARLAGAAPELIAGTAAALGLTIQKRIGGVVALPAAIAGTLPDDGIAAAQRSGFDGHQLAEALTADIPEAGTLACIRQAAAAPGVSADQRAGYYGGFPAAIALAAPKIAAVTLFAGALDGHQLAEALAADILRALLAAAAAAGAGLIHGERMIGDIFDFSAVAAAFPYALAVSAGYAFQRRQFTEALAADIKAIVYIQCHASSVSITLQTPGCF